MYGYIYKTTNLISGKIYIGQKKSNIFLANKYLGSGIRLKEAVAKYGQNNFDVVLIDTAETKEELDAKEIYWIDYYDSKNKAIGYNIANGGYWSTNYHSGMLGKTQSNKQKTAVSTYMKNRIVTEETRIKMSNSAKNRTKNRKTINGKHWIYKENHIIPINSQDINYYLSIGYKLGSPKSETVKNNLKIKYSNGIYVHKDTIIKFISLEELPYYKANGFIEGKGKRSKSVGNNISKAKKNTIAITDGQKLKYIKPDDWEQYKEKGYYKCSLITFNKINEKYKETPDELREHLKILQN